MYQKLRSDDVRFLRYSAWQMQLFFILGHFSLFYPPNSPKNQNFKKMKKSLEISSFYICVPKIKIRWCTVPEIYCATDGRTNERKDGWKKWHIEVGAPPKIFLDNLRWRRSHSGKITENFTYSHKITFKLHECCLFIVYFISIKTQILYSDRLTKNQGWKFNN